MVIVIRAGTAAPQIDAVRELVETRGMRTFLSTAPGRILVGCAESTDEGIQSELSECPWVEDLIAVPNPLTAKVVAPCQTIVPVSGRAIGGREICVIAGPCSVENEEMLRATATAVRGAGAAMLRGGAFKPRTSPYTFQGLGIRALELLAEARRETGLPVVTEVMDPRQVDLVAGYADMLQIGARNMQNYPLLAEVGRTRRPVLLKRGLSATVTELLLAAEYILARGNSAVVLCERGIRTFEPATRYTLDVAAIPVLKRETHLPVMVDPSHAGGHDWLVAPLACAALAAGADGLIVEVHPDPTHALSDGAQSLTLDGFAGLMQQLLPFAAAAGRAMTGYQPPLAQEAA